MRSHRYVFMKVNFWLQATSAFRAMHYSNIFLMCLQKLNTMQSALSVMQFSEAALLSVYVQPIYSWWIFAYSKNSTDFGRTRALQNTGGALSYIARWENWYATGNFGQERLWGRIVVTRSDGESIFQQQFGEYHGDDGCYSIYFDNSTIVRLSGLL